MQGSASSAHITTPGILSKQGRTDTLQVDGALPSSSTSDPTSTGTQLRPVSTQVAQQLRKVFLLLRSGCRCQRRHNVVLLQRGRQAEAGGGVTALCWHGSCAACRASTRGAGHIAGPVAQLCRLPQRQVG